MRRLPPLNPLRAFEAAARHQHFGQAADELCVTVSAVSHQVKALEDHLGVKLFAKQGRTVSLTTAGRNLLPAIQQSLDLIAEACELTMKPGLSGRLTLSAPPEITSKWLIHQIGSFADQHPMIDISLLEHSSDAQTINSQADITIIYDAGNADWDRYWVTPIGDLEFYPVCSPKLLEQGPPLRQPDDLRGHRLLHDDQSGKTWATWLGAHAPDVLKAPQHLNFAHAGLSLEAAIAGLGVAMGDKIIASADLQSGALVRPFSERVHSLGNYYLVAEKRKKADAKIQLFTDWLMQQLHDL
ncbi:transcriptional regulator GcvA [Neptuniibacter halophilus]|uniref:transcriptional regulator GcvA n=1 Tax=Neptuniibacter halophilus TaxID=651666 RepID=UPI0025735A13|nr:transcriptional regulator GcvA [Neptuniibacter halophilus]